MKANLIEELRWRGLLQDLTPETEAYLSKNKTKGYIGFDPTADSLHVGSMLPVYILKHMQRFGHTPMALIGGATGMVGDPSGKSEERNLLDENTLQKNVDGLRKQLEKFLDFETKDNPAVLVNNFDWIGKFSFLEFIRDVGKHITVNYMMAKDSVKKRIETGISFTEFSYQLIQGYDFYHLYKNHDVKLQCGGSDQWGNITTGTELIRKMDSGKAYAFTCPLLTKPDGSKFGKSEGGNIWLDAEKTSPYKFYQFWINQSDEQAEKLIKIFTFKTEEEINELVAEHNEAPHLRVLQKALAKSITTDVHSAEAYERAVTASQILFKGDKAALSSLSVNEMKEVFDGVPMFSLTVTDVAAGIPIIEFLAEKNSILDSKSEARRALKENSVSINKAKVKDDYTITQNDLLANGFILVQRGKKKKFLVEVVN